MKRTNSFIKFAAVLLFAATVCYIGIYLYDSASNPFRTVLAVGGSVSESAPVYGIIIRDETLVHTDTETVETVAGEGEKVAAGETIAVVYDSEEALAEAKKLSSLKLQAENLAAVLSGDGKEDAEAAVAGLVAGVRKKDLSGLETAALEIKSLVFLTASADELQEQLAQKREEIKRIEALGIEGKTLIIADSPAVFYPEADGYEYLKPDGISALSLAALDEILDASRSPATETGTVGKLIAGLKWYFVAKMDCADADKLSEGQTARLSFTGYSGAGLAMRVESLSGGEEKEQIAVFSSGAGLAEMLKFRRLSAEIVFGETEGIRIPRAAVKLDEANRPCIYTLSGSQAKLKNIEIIYETKDYYLVAKDEQSAGALRIGDEIIVSSLDLYDGKVVK